MSIISQFRLLIPEEVELSSDDYALAQQWSNKFPEEALNWQSYLNGLGMLAFEHWLQQRDSKVKAKRNTNNLEQVAYLEIKGFKLCLVAQEDFLEEEIIVPKKFIDQPDLAAHFYGVVADHYRIALNDFDPELNHFLADCRYLEPTAIALPQNQSQVVRETISDSVTKLGQWLEGIVTEGWQTLDQLLMPEAQLAFATRNLGDNLQWGKLIDLGLSFGEQKVVLLMTLKPVEENKIRVQVRLSPFNTDHLPTDLQLKLKSRSGKIVQSVATRQKDNYIQLKPFKSQVGKIFQLEVSGDGFALRETFEL